MIVQNAYNHKSNEYFKIDDIYEDSLKPNGRSYCTVVNCNYVNPKTGRKCQQGSNKKEYRLNATGLEQYLARINKGSKRRLANNHAARLAQFKAR